MYKFSLFHLIIVIRYIDSTSIPNITTIVFPKTSVYDQEMYNLPSTITHLQLGAIYNQDLDNLPPRLTHLELGSGYNRPLDKLPPTLVWLSGIYYFNKEK